MEDLKKFFIDGKWIIPNSTNIFPVTDPSNEKTFAEIILGNDKDVEAAVYAAKKAFNIFSSFSKDDRLKLLENLLSVMEKRFEDLAKSMTKEMGAPIKFSRKPSIIRREIVASITPIIRTAQKPNLIIYPFIPSNISASSDRL